MKWFIWQWENIITLFHNGKIRIKRQNIGPMILLKGFPYVLLFLLYFVRGSWNSFPYTECQKGFLWSLIKLWPCGRFRLYAIWMEESIGKIWLKIWKMNKCWSAEATCEYLKPILLTTGRRSWKNLEVTGEFDCLHGLWVLHSWSVGESKSRLDSQHFM